MNLNPPSSISSNFFLTSSQISTNFLARFSFYAGDKTVLSKIPKGPTDLKAGSNLICVPWKPSAPNRPQEEACVSTSRSGGAWERKTSPGRRELKVAPVFRLALIMVSECPPESPRLTWGRGGGVLPGRVGGWSFAVYVSVDGGAHGRREHQSGASSLPGSFPTPAIWKHAALSQLLAQGTSLPRRADITTRRR